MFERIVNKALNEMKTKYVLSCFIGWDTLTSSQVFTLVSTSYVRGSQFQKQ